MPDWPVWRLDNSYLAVFPQSFDLIPIHPGHASPGCRKPVARRWQSRSAVGRFGRRRASFRANFERRRSRCVHGEATGEQLHSMPAVLFGPGGGTSRRRHSFPSTLTLSCLEDQPRPHPPDLLARTTPEPSSLPTLRSFDIVLCAPFTEKTCSNATWDCGCSTCVGNGMIARLAPRCGSAAHCHFGNCTDVRAHA
jgi:hypothetical protein